jgi:hypothetical protein
MYLLDANVFITAKNAHYGFDIVPGFWSWLEHGHQTGVLASITAIQDELDAGEDELKTWATTHREIFLPWDNPTTTSMAKIAAWTMSCSNYSDLAKAEFLAKADSKIVAYAHAHHHTVVTHERSQPSAKKRILIPDACKALNVAYIDPYSMLRNESAKFVLV